MFTKATDWIIFVLAMIGAVVGIWWIAREAQACGRSIEISESSVR